MSTPKERAQNALYNYLDRAANSPYGTKFNQDNRTEINDIISDIIAATIEELKGEFILEIHNAKLTIVDNK